MHLQRHKSSRELMVQLKNFITSNFLLKRIIALIILSHKIERKNEKKKLSNSFVISKNIISAKKFSARLLIGQNDSLDVILMEEFTCDLKRVEMTYPYFFKPLILRLQALRASLTENRETYMSISIQSRTIQ